MKGLCLRPLSVIITLGTCRELRNLVSKKRGNHQLKLPIYSLAKVSNMTCLFICLFVMTQGATFSISVACYSYHAGFGKSGCSSSSIRSFSHDVLPIYRRVHCLPHVQNRQGKYTRVHVSLKREKSIAINASWAGLFTLQVVSLWAVPFMRTLSLWTVNLQPLQEQSSWFWEQVIGHHLLELIYWIRYTMY